MKHSDLSPVTAITRSRILTGLVILLVLGTVLRIWGVGNDSLWNNEVLSYERASQASWAGSYALIREGTHPPLYSQGVLRPMFLIGNSEFYQRLPSAIFGVATIVLIFLLGRALFSAKVGLAAAALLTITPLHLYYSREGRMYALLALLTTAWLYFLARAHTSNRWSDWLGYALLAAASLYTHYYSGLTLLSVAVFVTLYLLIAGKPGQWLRWLVANALAIVLFLPWLPTFWYQLKSDHGTPSLEVTASQPVNLLLQFFTAFESPAPWLRASLFICLVILLGASLWAGVKSRSRGDSMVFAGGLLLAAVGGTLLLASLISLHKPMLYIRYFVGVVPAFLVLLAVGALILRPGIIAKVAFAGVLLVSGWYTLTIMTHSWRPDFRSPVSHIIEHQQQGEVLFVVAPSGDDLHMKPFHHYYDGSLPVTYQYGRNSREPELRKVLEALPAAVEGVWVLQHRRIIRLGDVPGFTMKYNRVWRARSFERRVRTSLTYLER